MKKYIGDKTFYRMVFALALPMLLQNTVSNFVNLLDNLMVGQTGTEQMSGVSIVNMILFVYNLCLFGGTSGAGIFGAQFYGKKDTDGVRYSLRLMKRRTGKGGEETPPEKLNSDTKKAETE